MKALGNDSDVLNMVQYVAEFKVIEVYIEHWQTSLDTYFTPNSVSNVVLEEIVEEPQVLPQTVRKRPSLEWNGDVIAGECSKLMDLLEFGDDREGDREADREVDREADIEADREVDREDDTEADREDDKEDDREADSDYIVDKDNIIDDVEVDMRTFRDNIDVGVEWIGSQEPIENIEIDIEGTEQPVNLDDFDSETDFDKESSKRKKALKKIREDNQFNDGFYLNQTFGDNAAIKEMVTRVAVERRRHCIMSRMIIIGLE